MPETFYLIDLSEDVRKRHYHKASRGQIVDFVVQLEVRVGSEWKTVVRYDCSHGYAHRDRYNLKGEKRTDDLRFLSYNETLSLADRDINRNWEEYKERFLRGGFP